MYEHWAFRTRAGHKPFAIFDTARHAWETLQSVFPEALAVVLMPDHVHLVLKSDIRSAMRIGSAMSGIQSLCAGHPIWSRLDPPREIPNLQHLRRHVRYVLLNPCRAGLCQDPLEWLWSTHRDVMGATVIPWTPAARLAKILGEAEATFRARFHAYVSGDPSVAVSGTPLPEL